MPTLTSLRNVRELPRLLHSTDGLLISFWCLLSLISIIFNSRIPGWWLIVLADFAACSMASALALCAKSGGSRVLQWVHDWAAFPLVVFTYKQVYFMISPIHQGKDYDEVLLALDRWLLRGHSIEWLAGLANPWLTEALQIAYSLFYVFFIAVGLELYRKKDLSSFRYFRFTVVYGFFLSYAAYFFMPAVGPRFALFDFSRIDTDLPGLSLTPALRWFVNIFESIPSGASNTVALASAQRDVFPSGHTMMTVVAILMAYRYKLRVRHWVFGVGMMLIFSTVYLRYHYFVDLLAGAFLVLPCILTSNKVYRLLGSR